MNETRTLIRDLKESGQDHEFYPTTDEICRAFLDDVDTCSSSGGYWSRTISNLLDIGAGNGKVLRAVDERFDFKLYAIEKSQILYSHLVDIACVIGTDFESQTLLGKNIDAVFCNPPYSRFTDWAEKIIQEAEAHYAWLVIPSRWRESSRIQAALDYRKAEAKIIGSYDFLCAEDRKARAVVDLIRITFRKAKGEEDDAFTQFFNRQFGHLTEKFENEQEKSLQERLAEEDGASEEGLAKGRNLIERLCVFCDADMAHTKRNYEAAASLDVALLRELHVSPKDIVEKLKMRLASLRNEYWDELLDNLKEVTNRLCHKQREAMLDKIKSVGQVDFSADNAYAVVCWMLENANAYMEEQIVDVFGDMVDKANVRNYKSNQRVFEYDRWRYSWRYEKDNRPSHVYLEYRIVLQGHYGLSSSFGSKYSLSEAGADFVRDMMTVANNLGFRSDNTDNRFTYRGREGWQSNRNELFFYKDENGEPKVLIEVKAFKNGNMHIRMAQDFALALNVEVGRLLGWLKNPQQAADELGDERAAAMFNTHICLNMRNVKMLGVG